MFPVSNGKQRTRDQSDAFHAWVGHQWEGDTFSTSGQLNGAVSPLASSPELVDIALGVVS